MSAAAPPVAPRPVVTPAQQQQRIDQLLDHISLLNARTERTAAVVIAAVPDVQVRRRILDALRGRVEGAQR